MRVLRGTAGALLWVLAAVVGLVSVVLSVTIVLAPVGIPLFLLARRLFGVAVRLMMPRSVTHPVSESKKSLRKAGKKARDVAPSKDLARSGRKWMKRKRKKLPRKLR